jgi:hypothetical protein
MVVVLTWKGAVVLPNPIACRALAGGLHRDSPYLVVEEEAEEGFGGFENQGFVVLVNVVAVENRDWPDRPVHRAVFYICFAPLSRLESKKSMIKFFAWSASRGRQPKENFV